MEETEQAARREFLRQFLAERDFDCPGCGYNLRGLPEAVCPECRHELQLTVGLVESRVGSLVVAVGSLLAGAGAAGALMLTVVFISMVHGWPPRGYAVALVWLPLGCVMTCGLGAWRLGRPSGRRWFRTMPAHELRGVLCAAVGLPLAWFVAFLVAFMMRVL